MVKIQFITFLYYQIFSTTVACRWALANSSHKAMPCGEGISYLFTLGLTDTVKKNHVITYKTLNSKIFIVEGKNKYKFLKLDIHN